MKDLCISNDFGETWVNSTQASRGRIAGFWGAQWAANLDTEGNQGSYTNSTILATVYESLADLHGIYNWDNKYDKNIHFVRSDDFFNSKHEKVFSCGNIIKRVGSVVYLIAPSSCDLEDDRGKRQDETAKKHAIDNDENHAKLYVSKDYGRKFTEVCMPVSLPAENFAFIDDDKNGGIFVTAVHNLHVRRQAVKMAYAYKAGNVLNLMTLSLRNIYCTDYACEFEKISGVRGTFVANKIDLKSLDETGPSMANVKTMITFNNGATWAPIPAPTLYNDDRCKRCEPGTEECNLNLHIISNWDTGEDATPPLYSHENAPGVIMAVGNTGPTFDREASNMCTYLSRDGGRNWEQVLPGPYVYEFGDHGGIIVAARHRSQGITDQVMFSTDQVRRPPDIFILEKASDTEFTRVDAGTSPSLSMRQ